MSKPTGTHFDAARQLLVREAHDAKSAAEHAAAAGRVYERIVAHLATLMGQSAARALFARSVKLTASNFPRLGTISLVIERADTLGEQLVGCLSKEPPDVVTETAVALYATLLALLGTLIGERLTSKVLRDLWPAIEASPPQKETK